MAFIRRCVLYTALIFCANAVLADPGLEALREGTMKKLVFHSTPQDTSKAEFFDEADAAMTLEAFHGKYILLNFWATWCAPCRKEMPGLNALQTEFGGDDFQVVTIATGRNPAAAIRRFFEEVGADALPKYVDPKQKLARDMAVLGLPISLILDPQGYEIARLRGDADWHSDSARAIISRLVATPAGN